VNAFPVASASNTGPYCEGAAIYLSASGGGTYSWTGPTGFSSSVQNPTLNDSDATKSGTYALTVTLNGCNASASTSVTVHPKPNVWAGNDLTICLGEKVTLEASGTNSYQWDNGAINGSTFSPSLTGITVYTVTGTNQYGCVATDQTTLTVKDTPTVNFSPDTTSGCVPLTVNFTNTSSEGVTCLWQMGSGTKPVMGCETVTHTFESGGCYDISLTVTSTNGCQNTLTAPELICVEEYPIASFIPSKSELTEVDGLVSFKNETINASTYLWDFGDSSSGSSKENPFHNYEGKEIGTYVVTLIANSSFGCTDTAKSVIQMYEELIYYVPNTFTPDHNNFNQTFQPIFTSGFDPMYFNMKIFNRWGELIFETNDAAVGWNGSYGSGGEIARVQEGVYTWKIEFRLTRNDDRKILVGHVNLMR
jgi:gliding motility-associated-like protein